MPNETTVAEIERAEKQLKELLTMLCSQFHANYGVYPILSSIKKETISHMGTLVAYEVEVEITI